MKHVLEGYIKVPCEDWYISFDKMKIKWEDDNIYDFSRLERKNGVWGYVSREDNIWTSFEADDDEETDHNPIIQLMYEVWLGKNGNKKTSPNT